MSKPGDLMYIIVIIVNNTALYTTKLPRDYILNVLTIKQKWKFCDTIQALANQFTIYECIALPGCSFSWSIILYTKMLWVQSPVKTCTRGNQLMFLSLSAPPTLPKSMKTYPRVRIKKSIKSMCAHLKITQIICPLYLDKPEV